MAKAPAKTETKKPGTAVATAKRTDVAQVPAHLRDMMEEDAGKGVSTNSSDVGIPFLAILQDMSPQVKKRDEKYIDGAEVGMILNNQSGEIWDGEEGVQFLPCFFESCLIEWVPRDAGGGYVAKYPDGDPILRKTTRPDRKKAPVLENGNHIVQTKYYFGLLKKQDGTIEAVCVGLSSSGLKVSREWMRQIKNLKTPSGGLAPSFSKWYDLKTKLAKNGAGQEYFTWSITQGEWAEADEYSAGRTLESECAKGAVQASRPDQAAVGGADDEEVL